METDMEKNASKNLKPLHLFSLALLMIGFGGILFGLVLRPAAFPTFFLFLTAFGTMLSVAVSTKYLAWRQYE